MAKINWGTTAEVLAGAGTKVAQKMGEKRQQAKEQKTDYDSAPITPAQPYTPSYHKGGKVRKTGLARLKKGERVLTKPQQRKAGLLKKR
jgi:hypothetical protein